MNLFNQFTREETQEEKMLKKFLDIDLTWRRDDDYCPSRYKAIFQTKQTVEYPPGEGLIQIDEFCDANKPVYHIYINIGITGDLPFKFSSESRIAKALIRQTQAQIKEREDKKEQQDKNELEKQYSYILGLLP